MEYDKKESHVRVVISDNLERGIENGRKNTRNIFFFISRRRGNANGNRNGMGWSEMGHNMAGKTEESWPKHTLKMSESVRR